MKRAHVAKAIPIDASTEKTSMLHVSIREVRHIPLEPGRGPSIGQMMDQLMEETAMNGGVIEGFELEITPDHWQEYAGLVNRDRA
jgi:hypothetical protein